MLDVTNYTWVNRFEPDKSVGDKPDDNKKSNTIPIVIGAVGGVVGIAVVGFIGYRWYRNKQNNRNVQDGILRIPDG